MGGFQEDSEVEVISKRQGLKVGLLDLPPELLREITEYLPRLPFPLAPTLIPTAHLNSPFMHNDPIIQRNRTLRALSSSCRTLRAVMLPLAWESIQSVSIPVPGGLGEDALAKMTATERWKMEENCHVHLNWALIEQLLLVTIACPDLAPYVRSVVFLCGKVTTTLIQRLGQLLPLLPNLDTFQFLSLSESASGVETYDSADFAKIFFSETFEINLPSIRRLAIPAVAQVLVECCPHLEDIAVIIGSKRPQDAREIYEEVSLRYPHIKRFIGFPFDWVTMIDDFIANCKEITHIRLNDALRYYIHASEGNVNKLPSLEHIKRFRELPSLRHIQFYAPRTTTNNEGYLLREDQDMIAQCLLVLGGASGVDPKPNPNVAYGEKHEGNYFFVPSVHAIFPPWLVDHLQANGWVTRRPPGPWARTLTVDVSLIRRVLVFTVEPSDNPNVLKLASVKVGHRTFDCLEEIYDLEEIPFTL